MSIPPADSYSDTLESVINQALQSNPEVMASYNQLLISRQQLEQARGGYHPSINLIAAMGREASENVATGFVEETLTRQEVKLELRQNLFSGFATESRVAREQALVRSADEALDSNRDVTALRVAEAYINVLRYRSIVELSRDFVNAHQDIYRKIEKRSSSGVGRKSEKIHAAGRLSLAKSNLIAANARLDDATSDYLAVVGDLPARDMALPDARAVVGTLEQALQKAMANNPQLAEANARLEAAVQGRRISNSEFYPEIDLVVSGSRNEDLDGVVGADDDQSIMLQLKYNLYNGGSDSARKQQAAYEIERARYLRDHSQRLVEQKLRFAWNDMKARQHQLKDLEQHVIASNKTRDVYTDQYRIGQRTLLDLLDTENELFNARLSHVHALHDRYVAEYRLLAQMGGLRSASRE